MNQNSERGAVLIALLAAMIAILTLSAVLVTTIGETSYFSTGVDSHNQAYYNNEFAVNYFDGLPSSDTIRTNILNGETVTVTFDSENSATYSYNSDSEILSITGSSPAGSYVATQQIVGWVDPENGEKVTVTDGDGNEEEIVVGGQPEFDSDGNLTDVWFGQAIIGLNDQASTVKIQGKVFSGNDKTNSGAGWGTGGENGHVITPNGSAQKAVDINSGGIKGDVVVGQDNTVVPGNEPEQNDGVSGENKLDGGEGQLSITLEFPLLLPPNQTAIPYTISGNAHKYDEKNKTLTLGEGGLDAVRYSEFKLQNGTLHIVEDTVMVVENVFELTNSNMRIDSGKQLTLYVGGESKFKSKLVSGAEHDSSQFFLSGYTQNSKVVVESGALVHGILYNPATHTEIKGKVYGTVISFTITLDGSIIYDENLAYQP